LERAPRIEPALATKHICANRCCNLMTTAPGPQVQATNRKNLEVRSFSGHFAYK